MTVGEVVGVHTAEEPMFRPFHHQSSDIDWMPVPTKATDATEASRREHQRSVERKSSRSIRQAAESDAVDLRVGISVPAGPGQRVDQRFFGPLIADPGSPCGFDGGQ